MSGFPQAKSWKSWKITLKSSMHGKIMEFEINWKSWKSHGILWNNLTKPPVARKLAVGHLCVRQLVFWLLVVLSFNYFKMHAWSTSMLLLLHSSFMLSLVKLVLKGEDGAFALNSHGNYIVDRGKIMELCFRISVVTLSCVCVCKSSLIWTCYFLIPDLGEGAQWSQ